MSCKNCADRVENALNAIDGVWARVDLMEEEADLYMKQETDDETLRAAVKAAGYTVYKINTFNESESRFSNLFQAASDSLGLSYRL